ncbi:MAG: patatin-like protein [Actinomycetota bacterium]|nr:patatin-like protein [Actinomycetota bacterium]
MTSPETTSHALADTKELRLALVLYGGVSLAIYMHGTTKEMHRLVRASASLDAVDGGDRPDLTQSERVYRDLLRSKAEKEEGVRTRVVIDVIAATSAGGINGVYLAKALAHDLSQDSLRDLWFDRGDIRQLLRGPKRAPWRSRLAWVAATIWWKPALDGDRMSVWLFDALEGMDETATARKGMGTLVPSGCELQLFVTITDFYGYERELVIDDPPIVYDRRHRHVMEFRYGDGQDDFRAERLDSAALAYAARATSCFPGGFPPVSFAAFEGYLRRWKKIEVDLSQLEGRRLFRHYQLSHADVRSRHFIDGGVIDNFPFGHALTAIRQKPAWVQVDRRLLYLDPDPADPLPHEVRGQPRPIATLLASISGIPRREPILDEILATERLNQRVRQIRDVIETNWSAVTDWVEKALAGEDLADLPEQPGDDRLVGWRDRIHERAIAESGLGYATYIRAKIGAVVEGWANTVCRLSRFPHDCSQAAFVRTALREWAARAELFQKRQAEPTPAQVSFLRDLDLGYGVRRLRFVVAALRWWYREEEPFPLPTRAQLNAAKKQLYEAIEELRAAMRGEGIGAELERQVAACFGEQTLDPFLYQGAPGLDPYLDAKNAELDQLADNFRAHLQQRLSGFGEQLYRELHALTAAWHPEARKRILIRYLGFPLWDALLFPLQSVTRVGEGDHVEITRLSPLDATLIRPPHQPKLEGVKHHHFGAFFSRRGRESDYLWGRLDGAERMITILLGKDHQDRATWCWQAFNAILDEEHDALPNAKALVREVRQAAKGERPAPRAAGSGS